MAVAFDAKGSADATFTGTTVSFTNLTVGSGSNRGLIAVLIFFADPGAFSSVAWDSSGTNQAMTQIGSTQHNSTNNAYVALFGLVAPTSGNKTLKATWTNIVSGYIDAIAFTGVDQTGGATTFYNNNAATGSSAAPAVTITSASGDAAVDVTCGVVGNLSAPTQTQVFIDNSTQPGGSSYNLGSASVSFGWTISGSTAWVDFGVAIKAVAATGTVNLGTPRLLMGVGV